MCFTAMVFVQGCNIVQKIVFHLLYIHSFIHFNACLRGQSGQNLNSQILGWVKTKIFKALQVSVENNGTLMFTCIAPFHYTSKFRFRLK